MLNILRWPTSESQRYNSRLNQMDKIVHNRTPAVHLPTYFQPKQFPTRILHWYQYNILVISTIAYQQSFYSRTLSSGTVYQMILSILLKSLKEHSTVNFCNLITSTYNIIWGSLKSPTPGVFIVIVTSIISMDYEQ